MPESALVRQVDKHISILYLDDHVRDLRNFKQNVRMYLREVKEYDPDIDVEIETVSMVSEAIEILDSSDRVFDVFLCDHNMPQQKGLAFLIQYVQPSFPKLLNVLHSAAGNFIPDVVTKCEQHGIMLSYKTEEVSTLIDKLFERLHKANPQNPLLRIYKSLAADIVEDMLKVKSSDPSFKLLVGGEVYSPERIIREVESRSEFGLEYTLSYLKGLKFFNRK